MFAFYRPGCMAPNVTQCCILGLRRGARSNTKLFKVNEERWHHLGLRRSVQVQPAFLMEIVAVFYPTTNPRCVYKALWKHYTKI